MTILSAAHIRYLHTIFQIWPNFAKLLQAGSLALISHCLIFSFSTAFTQTVYAQASSTQTNSAPANSDSQASQSEVNHRQAELKTLLKELKSLQQRLEKKQGQKLSAETQFRDTEIHIGKLATQQKTLLAQQSLLHDQLAALTKEQRTLNQKIKQQQTYIASHLQAAYRVGKPNPITVMLSHNNPASADRQLMYFDYINRARAKQLETFQHIIDEKRRVGNSIKQKQQIVANNLSTLSKKKQQFSVLLSERERLLQKLNQSIGHDQKQLSSLKDNRQNLQTLIDEMSKVVNARPKAQVPTANFSSNWKAFSQAKGKLPWPVDGKLHKYFGRKRSGSDIKWQGVTIDAKTGEPVRAIYPGTVVFADWFKGQGLLMIIDHGHGYWSLYGRNQSLLQDVGTIVSAGETIATVGNSGGQGNPALYFEIRHNGQPDNPIRWCNRS